MNYRTHADLGGQSGHGPVVPEPETETEHFHAGWEPRALALTLAMGATGSWNIDMSRAARETLPDYSQLSYYQIWISALEKLLAEQGLVSTDELAAGRSFRAGAPIERVLRAPDVAATLASGSPTERHALAPARFKPGDGVRTRSDHAAHHTRLPGYAHGKQGVIESVQGAHVFADAHAQGLGEAPQWLYHVAFDGRELWGAQAAPGLSVALDAWESYLEPVTQ
ncbi:MAG: nitrile hydratase subunit beta [Rubrivivax sp.]